MFLLGGELVEPVAHGFELEARDFLVQVLGNDIHLRLEVFVVGAQIFGGKRLVGEAHVHDRSGMSFGSGKIDEAPFSKQVHLAAILHFIFIDERANFLLPAGQLLKRWNVDLHVEVAGVANNRSALHLFEMLAADHALVSRHGDVNVAFLDSFGHGHYPESIHHRFDALHRVDFRDDHVRAKSLGAHSHAAPAPAVTGNDHLQAGEQHVGGANNAVNRGLPGAVTIVKEMLRHRVIHGDDGILQRAILSHCAKANHAGGGFFRSGDHVRDEIGTLGQQHGDQVGAVVHGELRLVLQRRPQVRIIRVVILALDGEGRNVVVAIQRGGDFVLRG